MSTTSRIVDLAKRAISEHRSSSGSGPAAGSRPGADSRRTSGSEWGSIARQIVSALSRRNGGSNR